MTTIASVARPMLQHVFWKQLEVIGATGAAMGEFSDILDALFDGAIEPIVDSVTSLEEIPSAHERLSAGDCFGKNPS